MLSGCDLARKNIAKRLLNIMSHVPEGIAFLAYYFLFRNISVQGD